MRFQTIPFAIAIFVAAIAADLPSADAQHLRSWQPLQRGGRWLGQGWGTGYHHRNPGPNTDYYNPYTAHNSMLISQQPGYQAHNHQYQNQPLTPGVPYSVYAPTTGTNQNDWRYGHGQGIEATFVPTDPDDDGDIDPDDNGDMNSDGDNEAPDTPGVKNLSDMSISTDPDEPGSIRFDGDSFDDEDADFEESSTEGDESLDTDLNEASIEATSAGIRRRAHGNT